MNVREPHDFAKVRNRRQAKHVFRRIGKVFLVLGVVLLGVVLLGYASYARALPLITVQTTMLPAITVQEVTPTWPAQGQAAVGVLGQGVLSGTPNQKPLPTASTAKVMTALMVLQKHPLEPGQTGPMYTITPADVQAYRDYVAVGGSVVPVQAGQQITQYQAMQALLIPSANNIADLLAVWAYGSLPAYFEAANQKAQELGMTQTTFAGDASGLSPKSVSTPHDLVLLGQAAMQVPVIRQIVAQKTADLPIVGTVTNTDILLGRDGIVGIKTGNTEQAGGCFMFAADHMLPNGKTVTAIGAIMGAPNLPQAFAYTPPLLASFYQGFGEISIAPAGETVVRYGVPWSGSAAAQTTQDLSVVGWLGTKPTVAVAAEPLRVPAAAGTPAGALRAQTPYDEASVPIVLAQAVAEPTWYWRVTRF